MKLSETEIGKVYTVNNIILNQKIKKRLYDLGIVKGTKIRCVGKSPMGDPRAYLFRGSVVAVRKEEGEKIIVKEEKNEE